MTNDLDHLKSALADRYALERELGAGGMATVYLAEDLKHRRLVAIKVLHPELAAAIGSERFVREIEIAAKLSHPHILPLFDSGSAEDPTALRQTGLTAGLVPDRPTTFLYYVMPFVEGESLRERIDREGKLPVAEIVRLTDEIAAALTYAHEQGFVHRDVKPENILLSGGRAVVADFGIARAVTVAGGEKLTGTGFAVGTPAYMSPEQAFGDENVDGRSDVYALGCVAYEMVSGRAPFEGDTPQALLAKHAADTVPSLRASDPEIPLFVERAVERALAKSPADRFQTASAFAEALTSEMVVPRVGGRRWTRPVVTVPVMMVALAAAIWGFFTILSGPTYERLAVLPPTNLTNDPEQEYFVEGVHDALISELQLAGVAVIARTSVLRYQNTEQSISEIASELDADAIIEASVLRAADSVALEVRLVDGTTEEYLADPIARSGELRDVVSLYRELTSAIASEVQAALTPETAAILASARPVNPQAYEAYLRGQSHLRRGTPADLQQALGYYEQALLLDSAYAPAQAAIALLWANRAGLGFVPPREAAPHARAAAQRALALDSTLAEAHLAAAMVRNIIDWDWEGTEAAFRKAIEINPNFARARAAYALHLSTMERPDEARAQMDQALALDPYYPGIRTFNATILCDQRRFAECIDEYEAALRLEPDYPMAQMNLAWAFHENGDYEDALVQLRQWWFPGDQELDAALDRGYAEGGYRTALLRYAETLAARPELAERLCIAIALTFAWGGDKKRTLDWLEIAYLAHAPQLPMNLMLTARPELHDEPRFHDLRRRVGLER